MMNTYAHLKTSSAGGTVLAATDMLCSHRSPPRPIAMEHRTLNTPILVQQRGRGERKRSTTFRLLLPATPKKHSGRVWDGRETSGESAIPPPPPLLLGRRPANSGGRRKGTKKENQNSPSTVCRKVGGKWQNGKTVFFHKLGRRILPEFRSSLCLVLG